MFYVTGCESDNPDPANNGGNNNTDEWLIPASEIFDGGPGKDGIPSLENPVSSPSDDPEQYYLDDDDFVLAVDFSGEKKAYPHPVLDWHEIVNDKISEHFFALNYCPLTGTGMAWNRLLNDQITTFGVSGMLYNSNLILYDRQTDSYWSQMSLMCVKGEMSGQSADIYPALEMKWGTWKSIFPDSEVIERPGNSSRPYGSYPYGNYKTDNNYLLFPVSPKDDRLPQKERVLAVVGDEENAKVYRFSQNPGKYIFIKDAFFGNEFVVAGISNDFLIVYKEITTDGTEVDLNLTENKLPVIFTDASGSEWDVFGNGISGPNAGKKLVPETFINGFWFTFPSFFTNVEIHPYENS